jgi:hypothetical protein
MAVRQRFLAAHDIAGGETDRRSDQSEWRLGVGSWYADGEDEYTVLR